MIVENEKEAMMYIMIFNPNNTQFKYLQHIPKRINHYPINLQYCMDEMTGTRFGETAKRKDKNPQRIGSGGRNKDDKASWQLWIWDVD